MNSFKRLLTIQDISCVGQCSLTVALPIISACGVETSILPSAVLSTHTGGFKGFTFRDLTDDMPAIEEHWNKEKITFCAMYTGYLGSARQIEYVKHIAKTTLEDGAALIVDPAMADFGKLYTGFDLAFVEEMKKLAAVSDILIPNITEASYLTGLPYRESYDEAYIRDICSALLALGTKKVVITGVSFEDGYTGVYATDGKTSSYYKHKKLPGAFHGTGDVFASAFCGALVRGKSIDRCSQIAADFVVASIEATVPHKDHPYGVCFEQAIPKLISMLNKD